MRHVQVLTFCWETPVAYELPPSPSLKYLAHHRGSKGWLFKILSLPILAWRLKKHVQVHSITLVQSHLYRAHCVNVLSKILGSRHQVSMLIPDIFPFARGLGSYVKKIFLGFVFRQADSLVFQSCGMQSHFCQAFPRVQQAITYVIPNPCDVSFIKKAMKKPVRSSLPKFSGPFIVFCGRLIPGKRPADLLEAFGRIKDIYPDWHLVFLGQGSEESSLNQAIIDQDLQDRVHMVGHASNPFPILGKSEIFVSCSESEGWPNVIVEALACQCAVIAADCLSGPREMLDDNKDYSSLLSDSMHLGQYGILYPVGHIAWLQKVLEMLIQDSALRKRYQEIGQQRSQDFDLGKILPRYREILIDANKQS